MPDFPKLVVAVDAASIWQYSPRELTKYTATYEIVPKRYDSGTAVVLRSRGSLLGGKIVAYGTGTYLLTLEDDDLIKTATATLSSRIASDANVKDGDDTTYISLDGRNLAYDREETIITYDMGQVRTGFLYVYGGGKEGYARIRVYVSQDGSTYNQIWEYPITGTTGTLYLSSFAYYGTFRYVRINERETKSTTATDIWRCHTVEFYSNVVTGDASLTLPTNALKTLTILNRGGYLRALEVIPT